MDTEEDPEPVVGLTGARFGGAPRRKRTARARQERDRAEPDHTAESTTAGLPLAPETPPQPAPESGPTEPPADPFAGSAAVRPYVLTGGRTRATRELAIETLVSAVPAPSPPAHPTLSGEHRRLLGLCLEPRSVAELAARAGLPLGVVRVLVGDLVAQRAVVVHGTAGADGPDVALMQRVLNGLRRL